VVLGLTATGIGLLGVAASPLLAVAVAAQVVNGFGNGLENAGIDTLIQREVPRRLLGRVFGTVYGGAFLAAAIAYGAGGLLLDVTSPRTVFAIAGTGVLVVSMAAALALRGRGAAA
jgi:MFS family permease